MLNRWSDITPVGVRGPGLGSQDSISRGTYVQNIMWRMLSIYYARIQNIMWIAYLGEHTEYYVKNAQQAGKAQHTG